MPAQSDPAFKSAVQGAVARSNAQVRLTLKADFRAGSLSVLLPRADVSALGEHCKVLLHGRADF